MTPIRIPRARNYTQPVDPNLGLKMMHCLGRKVSRAVVWDRIYRPLREVFK